MFRAPCPWTTASLLHPTEPGLGTEKMQAPSEVLSIKNTEVWAVSAKGTLCSVKLKSILNEGCSVISYQTYVFIVDVMY